jgi:TetR/AcrR family transcriptional regulator
MAKSAQMPREPSAEDRILSAARSVFLRRGTAAARMHEIADEAGVNPALLHYYFRSKSRLAEAVFQQAIAQLFPPVAEALASEAPIEEKVRRVVSIELDLLSRNPHLPAYIIGEINQTPERALQFVEAASQLESRGVLRRITEVLEKQIDEGVKAGTMRKISAEHFVSNLLALCIFPFATKPMLKVILRFDDIGFERFIEERKTELPTFFLGAIRP